MAPDPRTGTIYTKHVALTEQASEPFHAVRKDDPVFSSINTSNFLKVSYGPEIFGNGIAATNGHTAVPNGSAVKIEDNGNISISNSSSSNPAFIKAQDKYYLPGSIARGVMTGMIPGREYWIQSNGSLGTNPVTSPGQWSILAGIALNSTDLIVFLHNQGQNN